MNLNKERNQRIDDLKERFIRGEYLNIKEICTLYRVSEQTARSYITQAKHIAELEKIKTPRRRASRRKTPRRVRGFGLPSEHFKVSDKYRHTIENAEKEYKKSGLKLFESIYPNNEGFTRKWGTPNQVKRWIKEAEELRREGGE